MKIKCCWSFEHKCVHLVFERHHQVLITLVLGLEFRFRAGVLVRVRVKTYSNWLTFADFIVLRNKRFCIFFIRENSLRCHQQKLCFCMRKFSKMKPPPKKTVEKHRTMVNTHTCTKFGVVLTMFNFTKICKISKFVKK